ncbi:CACTA en-spm transposon protein [Cucumis melo var. makuwa]|uniref:CACTA en-spm transposon protein n=1 Tax=Cucumis melo var. makuwa TaxID=1194695 RepID=A0A5A7VJW7_CUCMM|nr:CACTA en-spm transposon protein [Cucumis melo var. makuwa]TYK04099.1 CACTA en-spm transposon protein [Cucumis melo var. makuwa]
MGPSFDIHHYNGCIVCGLRFHTGELHSRRTTQNSGVMVIGESDASGSGDNNFYGVLDEVLHKVVQVIQNKRIWDVPEVDDVENEHINILEVVVSHQVDDHIKDDTLCRIDVDPTIIERSVVRYVTNDFIDDALCHRQYPCHNFLETDAMFLEFEDVLDNFAGGSSSVGDNAVESSSQQPETPTFRRRTQSRLLKLEHHVAVHGRIPMTIALDVEKPIFSHVVRFNKAIGVCVQKTFSVCCLWANIGREYIEVVKGDLQWFFVLDFNDQVMNRFVEHQMLTTFKEFRANCHIYFKKYSDPEEARANLQTYWLDVMRIGESVDRVELFRKIHVRVGMFVSPVTEDAHNQMLELQSQPTLEGSRPLTGMRYTIRCWVDDQATQKALVGDPSLRPAR